jgi:hypothetical protein
MIKAIYTIEVADIGTRTTDDHDKICNILVEVTKHALNKATKGEMHMLEFNMELVESIDTPEANEYVEKLTAKLKAANSKIILPGGKR